MYISLISDKSFNRGLGMRQTCVKKTTDLPVQLWQTCLWVEFSRPSNGALAFRGWQYSYASTSIKRNIRVDLSQVRYVWHQGTKLASVFVPYRLIIDRTVSARGGGKQRSAVPRKWNAARPRPAPARLAFVLAPLSGICPTDTSGAVAFLHKTVAFPESEPLTRRRKCLSPPSGMP